MFDSEICHLSFVIRTPDFKKNAHCLLCHIMLHNLQVQDANPLPMHRLHTESGLFYFLLFFALALERQVTGYRQMSRVFPIIIFPSPHSFPARW